MRRLEKVPSVRRIETNRPDVFAIEIIGEFGAADAENLCGLLEGAYEINATDSKRSERDADGNPLHAFPHPALGLLVRLSALESVDLSRLDADTVRTIRDHIGRHVARCAVIGDGTLAARIETLFAPGAEAQLRHFKPDEEVQAWAWIDMRQSGQGA